MKGLSAFSLKDKVAVVTGGYGHLGKSMTEGLADAGARVIVLGRNESKFKTAFKHRKDQTITFCEADIASSESIRGALSGIKKKFGGINILVNNAMYLEGNSFEGINDQQWALSMDGVLGSVFRCTREAVPFLKAKKGSAIINIGSMYGMVSPDFNVYVKRPGSFNPPSYGAAKAGVIQLTKYCSVYLAKDNIRVNCISPGPFPSPEVQKNKEFIKALSHKSPMQRIGQPKEIQGALIFLASDAASYVTGQNIAVDGGWTSW